MGIPERAYRIFKYKLVEIKEHFARLDAEAQERLAERRDQGTATYRGDTREDARRELNDALAGGSTAPPQPQAAPAAGIPAGVTARRTPEEIARGLAPSVPVTDARSVVPDALLFHYRCLGVEPGADFPAVQSAYNRLAARCDPSRFPTGSDEQRQARDLLTRLDASYRALREALDATARRFDLLEIDA